MDSTQECILGVTRIRRVFKYAGLCFVLLWILFGNYGPERVGRDRKGAVDGRDESFSLRKLQAINFSTDAKDDTFEV